MNINTKELEKGYNNKFKKSDNEKRLKFMEYVAEYETECRVRGLKNEINKKKDNFVYNDDSDLFQALWEKTWKLFNN